MQAGDPNKLGATPDDDGVNFALYSAVAERVELCLFGDDGCLSDQVDLPNCDDNIWHGFMPGITEGQRYGYRVHGAGCNPSKLLIDPYARQLDSELIWHASIFGSNSDDSTAYVPKSIVRSARPPLQKAVQIPWSETIFYEVNVRGYTMQHPAVNCGDRGRFNGMRNKDVVAYLKALGITSVELLPVHAFADEHHLAEQGLRNYWGYNSINLFAPAPRYYSNDPIEEFRDMVNALHDAGLEVILDVVYNHTAESGKNGPTLSYRGIDDRSYYRVADDGEYVNDTGCGNTIDADSPVVQQLIVDSLRYWATEMGVDGFRFDLATILGRHADGFSRDHPLLSAISNDSILRNRKLIAEPWDPGPGG
jgi:isoamylase